MARSPLAFLLYFSALVFAGCTSTDTAAPDSGDGVYANWSPDARFVGIKACAGCHLSQYETYIQSQMGRSFKRAVRSLSDAEWENVQPLHSQFDDMYYQPFARGENLFVREYRLTGTDTVHNRVEQIDYIVGSGQHTNSHIYEENGYLYQIPITWYSQDRKWGLAPKFQQAGNNYRFSRVITDECMACHNAQPTFLSGSENRFEFVPEGINCEKCHGPGSVHVEQMKAGVIVDTRTEIDYSIVNPSKLSPSLELDVCKRCHMQGASVFSRGQSPLSWRPGKQLAEHENVFWPRQPDSTIHFIMASHPDRLAMSSCFRESWKEGSKFKPITCLTCHDPHKAVEITRRVASSTSCLNCHESAEPEAPGCKEPSVVAGTSTVSCASCHMPLSGSTDIPNIRITDHYIRVPDRLNQSEIEDQTRFIRLVGLIDSGPDAQTMAEGFLTYYEQFTDRPGMLDSAQVYLTRAQAQSGNDISQSWIRLWHLQTDHAAIRRSAQNPVTEIRPDAWTYYRIGEAFAAIDDYDSAITWYEKAISLGKDHLRFRDKLGIAYTRSGRVEDALEVFDEIVADNPLFENGLNNRGFARLMTGQFEGAESDFKRALALSPDLELALANLASLYMNTERMEEARTILRTLIRRYPANLEYASAWQLVSRSD